ncbi:hypothetical protein SynA1825c_01619 [Synechococcus sp. A18-25c]|nr:hypothetical protein SynA1825c_01619 [Synechococcus sp. A18-25c]
MMGSEAIGSGATDNPPMPLGTAASSTHDDTARTGSGSLKDQNQHQHNQTQHDPEQGAGLSTGARSNRRPSST